jgi:hypothetical protein
MADQCAHVSSIRRVSRHERNGLAAQGVATTGSRILRLDPLEPLQPVEPRLSAGGATLQRPRRLHSGHNRAQRRPCADDR